MMNVFKFGGASVNSAAAIRNVASILASHRDGPVAVVFSAMGKTTNALEAVTASAFYQRPDLDEKISVVDDFHRRIITDLAGNDRSFHDFLSEHMAEIRRLCLDVPCHYDEFYDRIVPFGELISTGIISRYLDKNGIPNRLVPAFELIKTDERFRDANLDWTLSCRQIQRHAAEVPKEDPNTLMITQGFIGNSTSGRPVTLGREGSDFTAAVLAYCLDAKQMVVWKDVEGLLNADPVYFPETVRIPQISYREAIELSFYGAKILHPKTIKPLQNKGIPLYIKSFFNPAAAGSLIHESTHADHLIPFFILKKEQVLLSFSAKDFSFVTEDKLQRLFAAFNRFNIRINLMQNSAISFSVCINHPHEKLNLLIELLRNEFDIRYNENLELLTVRHFTDALIGEKMQGRQIILEQRSRKTCQLVYKS